jgi:hypothetical protein
MATLPSKGQWDWWDGTNGLSQWLLSDHNADGSHDFATSNVIPVYNVKSVTYGAAGDGVADDTAEIQAAIDACAAAGGGYVYFPAGTYNNTGLTVGDSCTLVGDGAKVSILQYTPATGDCLDFNNNDQINIIRLKVYSNNSSTGWGISSDATSATVDITIDQYEIEGFLGGIKIEWGLQVHIGRGRLIGQGKAVANGIGIQLGHLTNASPIVNTAHIHGAYASGYENNFHLRNSVAGMSYCTSETCITAVKWTARLHIANSWIQGDTYLLDPLVAGARVSVIGNVFYNGASVEQDWNSTMFNMAATESFGWHNGSSFVGEKIKLRDFSATGDIDGIRWYQDTSLRVIMEYLNATGFHIDSDTAIRLGTGGNLHLKINSTHVEAHKPFAFADTPQSLSGPGEINATTNITEYTSTGGAEALTIANGTEDGQIKYVCHIVDGGSGVLTGANLAGTSVTFTDDGDACTLLWTNSLWYVVGGNALFAP